MKRKTNEEFLKEVEDLVGEEYIFNEEYINTDTKISVTHSECGNTYKVTPSKFLNGRRCPECRKIENGLRSRKSPEQFEKEFYSLLGDGYTLESVYVKNSEKVRVKHNICGHRYEATPGNLLTGRRCPKCFKNHRLTTEDFKNKVYSLEGDNYTVIGTYKNNQTKIKMRHNECGGEYEVKPSGFLNGRRCNICYQDRLKTTEEFKKEVYELVGDDYVVLGEYTGNKNKISMLHTTCESLINPTPVNFLYGGNRCEVCSREIYSLGEDTIRGFLKDNGVNFSEEYTFPDCRDIKPLRYDFALKDSDDNLLLLVEYDGIHHFKPTYGIERFEDQKRKDNIKNDYCIKNNIPLVRIPYTEFDNLEGIIVRILKEVYDNETEKPIRNIVYINR